ncbi:hypothetical protein [Clostridium sp. Marseille-QA1073]
MDNKKIFNYSNEITCPIARVSANFLIINYGIEKFKSFCLDYGYAIEILERDYRCSLERLQGLFYKSVENIIVLYINTLTIGKT